MGIKVSTSGAASAAAAEKVGALVGDHFASRLFAQDATLWGAAAEAESAIRLGWTRAHEVSRDLVEGILALKAEFADAGVTRFVLCGMGGSSLAPEVITRTAGVELVVLDSTDPAQVRAAVEESLEKTAIIVSSKSGSTVETDSQRRTFAHAFEAAGIDPASRIVIVTDPGSPMEAASREAGYRVFLADPHVGGRFSALTAFGLVPSGLAGVDIAGLLDDAGVAATVVSVDDENNPALVLGAAIAAKRFLGVLDDGTSIVGFGDWVEQLIAESTGKDDLGILPVVLTSRAPEVAARPADLQLVRVVGDAEATPAGGDDIAVSGTLGGQFVLWETAVAVAGAVIGINPYDQPDVESAKVAARGLLEATPEPTPAAFAVDGVEVRGTQSVVEGQSTLSGAIDALVELIPSDGYLSVQAYVDRNRFGALEALRDELAQRSGRPVTFGWGPRFLHSTGQFHKGGPKVGAFLQITSAEPQDLEIPERPFTFGTLISAQAAGDASVLESHSQPVLRIDLGQGGHGLDALLGAISR
ncbi:glucose-6-phosphate isomerase [Pseudoclavibacter sp. Z016]|uniref:glucose-6-phosphate isomerase n=1 Tax=Pseudoclavibacter sp. Z016 TaxID=2080581 RepID=UPI000CE8A658|nr:glucose-6-phosphate isomerase [Pseudoclavibacter sp. Z016]PPF75795.1 glucose-6-phosphate isomerase [Pseudoclavibacter sp. Z016]